MAVALTVKTLKLVLDSSAARRGADEYAQAVQRVQNSSTAAAQSTTRLATAFEGVQQKMQSAGRAIATAFAALKLAQYTRETLGLADAYTNLHSRLALVTASAASLSRVQGQLFTASQQTRTGLESNVALYASLARSTKQLGFNESQLVGITRTVAQSFIISGASVSETNAAVRQLGQAMASGVLRGDEFNSIAENAPRLQQAVAASLGVTIGKLREMAQEGKITTSVLATALQKFGPEIAAEFQRMPITVGGAMVQVRNALLLSVGAVDSMSGASSRLAESISSFASSLAGAGTSVRVYATEIRSAATSLAALAAAFLAVKLGSVAATAGVAAFAVLAPHIQAVGAAFAVAQVTGGGFAAVMAGLSYTVAGTLAAIAPLALAIAGVGLAIYNVNKAFEDYDAKVEEASKNTKEYVAYLKALGRAHSQAGGAGQLEKPKTPPKDLTEEEKRAAEAARKRVEAARLGIEVARAENAEMHAMIDTLRRGQAAVDALTVSHAGNQAVREKGRGLSVALQASIRAEAEASASLTIALRKENALLEEGARVREFLADLRAREGAAKQAQEWKAADDAAFPIIAGKDAVEAGKKALKDLHDWQREQDRQYVDDMQAIWREGAGRIAADFVKSMSRGFEEVYSLAVRLMKRMEDAKKATGAGYAALKYGAAAIGGGLAGYGAGQAIGAAGGNAAQGALGGAASGAMAGAAFGPWGALVGGIAGAAAGLFGFGKAAKEAAKAMEEAQRSVRLSISGAEADLRGDAFGAGSARIRAEIEAMRKAVEDAFSGGSANSAQVRNRNTELARLNALETERIRILGEQLATAKRLLHEDVQIQIIRNNGDAERADALAKLYEQERRFADLREKGLDEATLAALRLSESARDAADAAKKAADAERERLEAVRQSARDDEDLVVRGLRARGQSRAADDAAFANAQRREYQDAVANGKKSPESLALLARTQEDERQWRKLEQSIADQTRAIEEASAAELARFDQELALADATLQTAREQVRLQEQSLAETERVLDALMKFRESLILGSLTTLSPVDQLEEARRQYTVLYGKAKTGDRDAATELPGAISAFLEASRAVNASGAAYAADFQRAQSELAAITTQYANRVSLEQEMVWRLTDAVGVAYSQYHAIEAARNAAEAHSRAQIEAINGTTAALGPMVDLYENIADFIRRNPTTTTTGSASPLIGTGGLIGSTTGAQGGGSRTWAETAAAQGYIETSPGVWERAAAALIASVQNMTPAFTPESVAAARAQMALEAQEAATHVLQAGFLQLSSDLELVRDELARNTTITKRGLESLSS